MYGNYYFEWPIILYDNFLYRIKRYRDSRKAHLERTKNTPKPKKDVEKTCITYSRTNFCIFHAWENLEFSIRMAISGLPRSGPPEYEN